MQCPRCGVVEPSRRKAATHDRSAKYDGIRVIERASTRPDDLLICLHCGCQFFRSGVKLHPHGIEVGREDVFVREVD